MKNLNKEAQEKADELVMLFTSLQINEKDKLPRIIESDMGKFAASTCAQAMIKESLKHNSERVEFWRLVHKLIS